MNRIINKILFIYRICKLGGDIRSKTIFLIENIRIQKNIYTKGLPRKFFCKIKNNNKFATVYFSGTLDEMHALTEIFIDRCYDPNTKNIKNVLDLGANIGLASIWFWLEFPGIIIHSYEPNPIVYELLKKNLTPLANTKIFNIAITKDGSLVDFNISGRSFSSSIYKTVEGKKNTSPIYYIR